jgi:hypothetical protein
MGRIEKRKQGSRPDGFINIPVSKETRDGLHLLKEAMGVGSQAEVIAKLVKLGTAIHYAAQE